MGRKRTSKKKKVLVSVDKEIYEKLLEWNVNRSLLFTDAALKIIEELEKREKND